MSNGNGSGTIIYTGSSVMCKTIFYHTEIGKYIWAQEGVSMSLGNKEWENIARKEGYASWLNNFNWYSLMLADNDCNIYLVVSNLQVYPSEFRAAIQRYFNITDGNSKGIIGTFLDGSTCAQLKCKEKDFTNERKLMTAIILENK